MVKTGQFTTKCKYDIFIALKRQVAAKLVAYSSRHISSRMPTTVAIHMCVIK